MITISFKCDICGAGFEGEYKANERIPGKESLIALLRKKGYSVGKQILCPRCKPWRKHSKD